ncbi:hypothetical protein H5V45_06945 [Nocardioides sp. KIGAM211]|uniref:SurA N-terminal domain-containing protein n=1 Tax=Nocardioides luti TaxID=2761101 RepID=A0A7X0VA03_9ACTN|nr:hypothetical protein [Nocardioides luti]MBB6627056.1 hypothetical protein [Nocardioides luti]
MSTTRRSLAGLVAGSALLVSGLSGCGVAGTDFHPGVAARVGDATVSVDEVDSLTDSYCSAIEDQLTKAKNVVPLGYLRSGVVGQLTLVEAAKQLAAEYGVSTGAQYEQKVAELRSAVAALSPDEQKAVIEIESSSAYLTDVLTAVGGQRLEEKGTKNPEPTASAAEGQKALTAWLDDHDVSIDPQFGLAIKDGKAVPTDTSLSYAVGDAAKKGQADSPDQVYAAALPDAHRCG